MNELVTLKGNDVFTDSLIISRGTGVTHRKLKETIRKHQKVMERFGKLSAPYQAESTGGRPEEYYLLNEEQATFLITLLKNTEAVVEFKARLVSEFYKMRRFILERQTQTWVETRRAGKLTRKAETDTIKKLVEYAKSQGSTHADMLYMTYSKLANKMAGISKRDEASVMQLNNLSLIENIILHVIDTGILTSRHYKEIYQDCKKRLETVKDLAFLEATA